MNPADPTPPPPPAAATPNVTREFKTRTASWVPYVFGGCFGTIGLLALVAGIAGFVMGGGGMSGIPLLFGIIFICVGIGIPVGNYFFGKTHTISCRPDGFSVRIDNKRQGSTQQDYRWEEVTSTDYDEFRSRSRNRGAKTYVSFKVETVRGMAFKVGREIGDLAGLISLFNSMTPHLPYTWQPQAGFSVKVGIFTAGRDAYIRVPRAGGEAPLPPPVPAAGATPPPLPS